MSATANFQQLANFIWSVADLLRGPYRPPQYERVMLPLTVLRRFDAVLAPSKAAVLKRHAELSSKGIPNIDAILNNLAKDEDGTPLGFHNHSQLDFPKLKGDPDNIGRHLANYINGFSENIRKIFERFEFEKEIEKLEESNRLYQVVAQFAEIDLHPRKVDNITMGLVFEDLIRRFNEAANETAGDHFTPREVIQLMVNLLLEPDTSVLTQAGVIVTICDPACGTGGMLAEAQNWIRAHNEQATVKVFGQDYNPRSYAVAASDLLIKGHKDGQVVLGNTLTDDPFPEHRFDYLLANPPFGVDWKAERKVIDRWPNFRGYSGKLPRINDGALLFLLYMMSKFQDYKSGDRDKPGSRAAIVFNGSPLFTGSAGSGESEIRRWIIEHDQLEAIVALPEQMFYNTGIGTFIWVVTNRKADHRKGRIQLIDARERYTAMKRSLGDKRRYLDQAALDAVTREHGAFANSKTSRIFDNTDFGYRRISVLRPLRLRFQITDEARERFLNTCPELFDALQAVQDALGNEPMLDWNQAWDAIQQVFKTLPDDVEGWAKGAKSTVQKKIFRDCFTTVDPEAAPVIAKHHKIEPLDRAALFPGQILPADITKDEIYTLLGLHKIPSPRARGAGGDGVYIEYEPDPALKDTESIPLKEDIVSYVLREVRPYVADAWIDRETLDEQDGGIGKVGYEINFNRVFFQYQPPRPLHEIDAELAAVEKRILCLLSEVTQ
ncbi:MAG: class I SAM-dependent DNA methyltransferase [Candidatus Accumulibacter sp. UW26]|jgi:type I restriction enzyme M protein|uniref:site-specific DNA-methyltransferase (adenine-specific) n=1 Tax=Candidatus Accumulibacter contiguus TaxID=2954381 RepID=A0ABX1TDB9_9PROT|nr:class I SAM-dependent DNA methyltransferase [Candidatus Accumulibacter contiguus]NMQ07690.1 SAM-dependent DNA methyltransferase [Candidatus Accumulibacter contiguus]